MTQVATTNSEDKKDHANITSTDSKNTKVLSDFANDPDNPKNWPHWKRECYHRRYYRTTLVSLCFTYFSEYPEIFLSSFASSILVPAVPDVMRQFHVTDRLTGTLTTSVYLGMGLGPFVLAPLSELYGRWIIYTSTLAAFTFLQIGCALSTSMTALIILRFFAGCTGGMAPSLGQASISDIWHPHERGRWAAMLTMGSMLGLPMGNFIASLILQRKQWPWVFWTLMIFSGVLLLLALFLLKETYEPVILHRRQKKQRPPNGLPAFSVMDGKQPVTPDLTRVFSHAITRPLRFLATSPILMIFAFFHAYTFGILYLLLTSLPLLFGNAQRRPELFNYGFNSRGTGFSYLGLCAGLFLGSLVQMYSQNKIWNFLTKRNGEGRPEYRLLPMTAGMIFFPASLLWYGWSAEKQYRWIFPEIATGRSFWTRNVHNFLYLTEAFIPYSASAMAAATLIRTITGAVYPLFGQKLFEALGYGKGGTLLAALAVPAIPLPLILYKHGRYIRERWEFTP
ncbi:major facilitator superfamily domain-containing protein [Gautieria morchelliformis]|nr:major facilitator superfamily domain-containing protein [Gautieria morchelliformis]